MGWGGNCTVQLPPAFLPLEEGEDPMAVGWRGGNGNCWYIGHGTKLKPKRRGSKLELTWIGEHLFDF